MTRKRVPLGNFVTEYSARNKNNEDIPVYSVTNSQGFCREYFGKEVASKDKTTYKIVPYGYFAYNPSRINVGSVDWQRCETQVIVSPLYNVFFVSDELDRQFLYYFLKSNIGRQMIRAKAAGSVRDNLKLDMLKEITIPESSLDDQRHCAATLDNLQHLIELRKKQLAELDNLIKARFVELFGNFVYEHGRWTICEIGDVADTIDPQPSHRTPPVSTDGVPYIGIAECNYKTLEIDFANARKVGRDVLQEHVNRYTLDKGDFIIGKIGTIGKPFFLPAKQTYTLSANTVLIKPNKQRVEPQFLFAVFQSEYMERIIDAEKKSTSQPAFGIQKIRKIEIPMPPMELQEQFAAFVERAEKSKAAIQKALDEAQLLFDSLMQEYFG